MSNSLPAFSAALADAAPVFPDRDATRDKTDAISGEARRKGARPAAFPESFLPGFPLWALVHAPIDTHGFFRRLDDHCLETHGPDIDRVAAMARRHGAYLAVGVTERSPASVGTLHNTNLPFDPDGAVVNTRRTLMPTWAEKLVWARGDAAGLRPARTQLGQIGILICGENTNPLARYALIAQGEQVHISTHPPVWPFRREAPPDYARWVMTRSVAHSFEAKVFNLTVAGHLDEAAIAARPFTSWSWRHGREKAGPRYRRGAGRLTSRTRVVMLAEAAPGIDLQPEVAVEVGGRVARDGHLAQDLRGVEI